MDPLFAKAVVIGFAIAAPVGPIGLLCIQRTLRGSPHAADLDEAVIEFLRYDRQRIDPRLAVLKQVRFPALIRAKHVLHLRRLGSGLRELSLQADDVVTRRFDLIYGDRNGLRGTFRRLVMRHRKLQKAKRGVLLLPECRHRPIHDRQFRSISSSTGVSFTPLIIPGGRIADERPALFHLPVARPLPQHVR